MQVSIFTDEINREDPVRAIELASSWGVSHVEVRNLPGGRFPRVPDSDLNAFFGQVCESGLKISGVSPGLFKCGVSDPGVSEALADELPRACEWARRWGTELVSCFGFARDVSPSIPDQVVDALGTMADIVHSAGCKLVLENEAVCWGATGLEAAEIIRKVGSHRLELCWDPGNSARAGSKEPFPGEYESLKDLVGHLHVKNFDPAEGQWAIADQGMVDWPGQFEALKVNNYDGFVVVETHLAISSDAFEVADPEFSELEANTFHNLSFVRSCLEQ